MCYFYKEKLSKFYVASRLELADVLSFLTIAIQRRSIKCNNSFCDIHRRKKERRTSKIRRGRKPNLKQINSITLPASHPCYKAQSVSSHYMRTLVLYLQQKVILQDLLGFQLLWSCQGLLVLCTA